MSDFHWALATYVSFFIGFFLAGAIGLALCRIPCEDDE